jgi:large subunit ribosomal protein L25
MGDTIRIGDVVLHKGVSPVVQDRDFVIATIKVSSAAMSEIAEEAANAAG